MIFLQDTSGDFNLSSGNLVPVTDPDAETAQRLTNRFRFFQGEWFLDTRLGTPWFQRILGLKNPDLLVVQRIIEDIVKGCPGIASVVSVTLDYNAAARTLAVAIEAKTQSGAIVEGQLGEAFIVTTGT